MTLFAKQGFDNTTIEQITDAADVSPRTFFRYFDSKEAVLFGARIGMREELLRTAFNARPPEEPVGVALTAAMIEILGAYRPDQDVLHRRFRDVMRQPAAQAAFARYQTHWEQLLTEIVAARLRVDANTSIEASVIAACTYAAVRSAIRVWAAKSKGADLMQEFQRAFDILTGDFAQHGPRSSP